MRIKITRLFILLRAMFKLFLKYSIYNELMR